MTDKELRKLSRLELLELLLEASKENRKLKKIIENQKLENATAQNIRNLSEATLRVENALKYANSLTNSLKASPNEVLPPIIHHIPSGSTEMKDKQAKSEYEMPSDKDIYLRMLCFLAKNEDKLSVFPTDIEIDVRNRIISILKKGTTN